MIATIESQLNTSSFPRAKGARKAAEGDSDSEIDALNSMGRNNMSCRLMLIAFVLCCSGISTRVNAQQISETYRKVNPSVVIVRVQQKTTSSEPQKGLVSLPSFGSGVLISTDGKILTAAHVVQLADRICVEFFDGQLIPARVIATSAAADVAFKP